MAFWNILILYGNTLFFNMDKNRMIDLITSGSIFGGFIILFIGLSYPISNESEEEANLRSYKVSDDEKI